MLRCSVTIIAIIIAQIGSHAASRANKQCAVNLNNDLGDPQPLYIRPRHNDFLMPRSGGIIRLNRSDPIEIHCSDGFGAPLSKRTHLMTCLGDRTFSINNETIEFNDVRCRRLPAHTARRTNQTCTNGEIVKIGYQVDNRWFNLMDVCHDAARARNHWVHHFLDPWNRFFQRQFPRINFIQGDFFPGLNMEILYRRGRQRSTLAKILGSESLAWELVPENGPLFMARGHMAARADYVFGTHQQGTFYFLNAAPQWQTFNGGNWERIETGIRNQIGRQNWNVELFTGTHGVLRLRDVRGEPREIFLSIDENGARVPVPQIYYKIAIETTSRRGIVFIGVNNPFATLEDVKRDFIFCEDVGDQVKYIPWDRHNTTAGYSYACAVQDFARRIPELPPLPTVTNLLL